MAARKKVVAPAVGSTAAEIVWAYGIRTWDKGGKSHGGFKWGLTAGARTECPDWSPRAECGNGLHCNPFGVGDWSLLGEMVGNGRVVGIVRYDSALAVDLDGKIKAPWMEVVITTETASLGSVLTALNPHRLAHIQGLTKVQKGAAATTGYSSAAATTGDSSAAATTGDSSAAATTGYRSAAATTGKSAIAAAIGAESTAMAGEGGAIMLAHFDTSVFPWLLKRVFAGMVGETHGATTIKPGVAYRLNADGSLAEAA